MQYHKNKKRKKALLAKKQADAEIWHHQRVQRVHLELWIVSFHSFKTLLDKVFFSSFGLSEVRVSTYINRIELDRSIDLYWGHSFFLYLSGIEFQGWVSERKERQNGWYLSLLYVSSLKVLFESIDLVSQNLIQRTSNL